MVENPIVIRPVANCIYGGFAMTGLIFFQATLKVCEGDWRILLKGNCTAPCGIVWSAWIHLLVGSAMAEDYQTPLLSCASPPHVESC